jgi:hypothetical protein
MAGWFWWAEVEAALRGERSAVVEHVCNLDGFHAD